MTKMQLARKLAAPVLTLSILGISAIGMHEGQRSVVYLDPVGIPTVCMGTTEGLTMSDVGTRLSAEACAERNKASLATAERAVKRHVRVLLSQEQYDSLVSFVFNVGEGAFLRSTLLRKLNAGDCTGAAAEFSKWNKAKGQILPGLVIRRAHEQKQFLKGCQ